MHQRLTYDYAEAEREDEQWIYLPALRKVRRVPASSRGDRFFGSDFSYEDIKLGRKVAIADYAWRALRAADVGEHPCWIVEATPVSADVAAQLGYGRVRLWVDTEIGMARKGEFWDVAGNALKTVHVGDVRQIQGVWTPHRLEAKSHKTGHTSVVTVRDVDYQGDVDAELFTERALRRGM